MNGHRNSPLKLYAIAKYPWKCFWGSLGAKICEFENDVNLSTLTALNIKFRAICNICVLHQVLRMWKIGCLGYHSNAPEQHEINSYIKIFLILIWTCFCKWRSLWNFSSVASINKILISNYLFLKMNRFKKFRRFRKWNPQTNPSIREGEIWALTYIFFGAKI